MDDSHVDNNLKEILVCVYYGLIVNNQGPVVQSVVSLTNSLRVISLTVLADSIYEGCSK